MRMVIYRKKVIKITQQENYDNAFEALKDIKIIADALISITEIECCRYGFEEVCKLAMKWIKKEGV